MKRGDRTTMGGTKETFPRTQWTEILKAQAGDSAQRRDAVGRLLSRYWKPVYCYIRRKGYDNEAAKDLTQGFFADVVLARGLVQKADRTKGRFRTFLLTALNRYATSARRRATAAKRMPGAGLIPLDGLDAATIPAPAGEATPEQAFNYAWASVLLDDVLVQVKQSCVGQGMEAHWAVFWERVVRPIRGNGRPPSLAKLCAAHGIDDERQASNMVVTVKRKFRKTLRDTVRQMVDSEAAVDEEIQALRAILSKGAAGR